MKRNRIHYAIFILTTILLGLFSRTQYIPDFIYPYFGDYLYAILFFLIFGFLFPYKKSFLILILSVVFCYGIEALQLYQADWINNIRNYKVGGLILGYGFLWSDMISYTLGGITAYFLERNYLKTTI